MNSPNMSPLPPGVSADRRSRAAHCLSLLFTAALSAGSGAWAAHGYGSNPYPAACAVYYGHGTSQYAEFASRSVSGIEAGLATVIPGSDLAGIAADVDNTKGNEVIAAYPKAFGVTIKEVELPGGYCQVANDIGLVFLKR